MDKNKNRVWLFDLDGTLIDSVGLIMDSFTHSMMKHRGEALSPEIFRNTIGRPLAEQFSLYSKDEAEIKNLIETYSEYYRANRAQSTLFSGVRELLETLAERKAPMAIVTSKSHIGAVNSTTALSIDHYFDIMIGSDDVQNGKPHPEPVLKALGHFQADPEVAVFIGDSPHDIRSGKQAHVKTIGVTWGPYSRQSLQDSGADVIVDEVAELLNT